MQRGGGDGRHAGVRAVPSLRYTQNLPPFTEHYVGDEEDDSIDQGPAGGRTWDGRAKSFHDQARLPLFSPFEMANRDARSLVLKVQAGHAAQFRKVFGWRIFEDGTLAFKGVLLALEAFQQSPAEFYPYSSKYDAYLRHQASLSVQELRGLAAFNDTEKGNCARCHPSAMQKGAFPQFTDFGFAAIGAPRNAAIAANAEPEYYDLGLCGPLRGDLRERREYCGMFRTPSLRNVARRRVFLHNGALHSLEDVVRFYAERDTQPQKWYPRASDGSVLKFDDLPAAYRRQCGHTGAVRSPCGRDGCHERARYCGYRHIFTGTERRIQTTLTHGLVVPWRHLLRKPHLPIEQRLMRIDLPWHTGIFAITWAAVGAARLSRLRRLRFRGLIGAKARRPHRPRRRLTGVRRTGCLRCP